jgi:hypothetical protein
MSIFPGSASAGSSSVPGLSRYVTPTAEDRVLFSNLAHRRGGIHVGRVSPLDDGTYEMVLIGPGSNGAYYVDRETLRRLSNGSMTFSDILSLDRDTAAQFGAQHLPSAARHRIARRVAQRRSHLRETTPRPEHAPAEAWKHGFEMALSGAPQPQGSASLSAGYAAGLAARDQQGSTVSYGAGALDSAWADITRGTVDAAGASLTCPSSLPKTTDYSRCTCAQLAAKKKYWQDKEWATPLGSADRKAYGARVNAIAMFEATCDQQTKGCGKGVETTDYSKLDCGCLEAKRRYWVDEAGKQTILSGKRELYEARANHIVSFKESCSKNKASSSTSSTSSTSPTSSASSTTIYPSTTMPTVSSSLAMPGGTASLPTFSAEQYAESAGMSALRALDAYAVGDYVTARQHAVSSKSMVDQAAAVGRPFVVGPKVRCAVEWSQTGIMGGGCVGSGLPVARPTFAPVLRPGIPVSGPIYSRPLPARPAVVRPLAGLGASRPLLASTRPTLPALSASRPSSLVHPTRGPVARGRLAFGGMDIFGGNDEDVFGGTEGDVLFGGVDEMLSYGLFDEDGV